MDKWLIAFVRLNDRKIKIEIIEIIEIVIK